MFCVLQSVLRDGVGWEGTYSSTSSPGSSGQNLSGSLF